MMMTRAHRRSKPALMNHAFGVAALVLAGMFAASGAQASSNLIPLYHWWSSANGDNMCSTDARWKGKTGDSKDGYRFVRIEGYLYSPEGTQPAGTTPLYSWWSPTRGDNFTTSQGAWAGRPGQGKDGYQFVRLEGYLPTASAAGRVPLSSFWSPSREDNFATSNPNWTSKSNVSPDYRKYRTEGYLEKTAGLAYVLPVSMVAHFALKTPEEAKREAEEKNRDLNPDAEGPGRQIQLSGGEPLVAQLEDFEFNDLERMVSLSTIVYEDDNRDSGVYYYRPRRWSLKWSEGEGYYLNFFSKPGGASGKNFLVNMTLTDGTVQRDRDLLKELLEVYLQRNPSGSSAAVKLRPLLADLEPEFNWSDLIEDEPEITQISYEGGEFVLSASVDAAERQVLVEALADSTFPLVGRVYYETESLPRFEVEASLDLADDRAYGRSPWVRNTEGAYTEFRNERDFTIRLNNLLYLHPVGNQLTLRGWDLGGRSLAPGAVARIPHEMIHAEIDDPETVHAWYDYSVEPTEVEMDAVLDAFRGGVGSIPETQARIRLANTESLFEQYGLDLVMVRVKSRFFDPDPQKTDWDERSYEFSRGDEANINIATLFAPGDTEEAMYQYRIVVYTAHDELASEWLAPSSNNPELIFVRAGQIEEILSE